jgi:hypothetical protein
MLRNLVSKAGRTTRLAWLVTFAVPMVVLALLAFAKPAPALDRGYAVTFVPSEPELSPPAIRALEEWDEEEEGEVEEEEGEDFADEDEEEEEESEMDGLFPPEECLLRTARSRVLAYPGPDKVKLTVNYTALAPADVAVDYRLTGKRGSFGLGQASRHFGKHGVLRLTAHLGEAGMKRVLSARSFTVDFDIAAAPSYCQRFYTHRLAIKRSAPKQTAWLQSDSPFGIG